MTNPAVLTVIFTKQIKHHPTKGVIKINARIQIVLLLQLTQTIIFAAVMVRLLFL